VAVVGDVLVVLIFGSVLGWLSQRLRFPNTVAQVGFGVRLDPPCSTGCRTPYSTPGEVGVVLLLGVACNYAIARLAHRLTRPRTWPSFVTYSGAVGIRRRIARY
jgi:Kef-type K+ transport system membrane component KefB